MPSMPHGAGSLEEPKDGWTRYFDPGAARTYLYCHQTGEWYFDPPESEKQSKSSELALNSAPQKPINASEQAGQVPIFGVSLQERPPAPALPAASTRAASMSADTGRDGAIQDLAKIDPIVQDLLRDELKLKKKLREIEALEVASQSKQLEAMQLTKLSKKESMLADLQTVQAHLAEALEDFKSRRIRNQAFDGFDGSRGVGAAPKLKAKQTQNVQRLNPLPQGGKALPVNPRLANKLGNSASRHPTLGYLRPESQAVHTEVTAEPPDAAYAAASAASGPVTRQSQRATDVLVADVDEDGFVAVRRGAKPKKASVRSVGATGPNGPTPPDEEAFWWCSRVLVVTLQSASFKKPGFAASRC